MKNKSRNRKGFTLIELIVVIAVLGILVLLAAPRFLGYTSDSKLAQIKADIKSYETAVGAELVYDDEFTSDWKKIDKDVLETHRDSNSLFYIEGLVGKDYEFNEDYLLIEDNLIKTKLDGDFYLGTGGEIYYYENGLKVKNQEEKEDNNGVVISPGTETPKVEESTPVEPEKEKEKVYEATAADFKWNVASGWTEENSSYNAVGKTGLGYFTYTGPTEDAVKIPDEIGGTPVTSYFKMFMLSDVKKVISDNPNVKSAAEMFIASNANSIDVSELNTSGIEDMQYMFFSTKATSINLGENFDTSKVKNMASMFSSSNATELDLSTFNTSNVTYMYAMFSSAKATSINFGENFDTSKVTDMGVMFQQSNIANLDLSHFDTSKVTNMSSMFNNAKSKTINLSSFDTSNVTDTSRMFFNVLNLESLDLSSFNTSGIRSTGDMFSNMTLNTVLVKSQADVTKLNAVTNKPSTMNFIVK